MPPVRSDEGERRAAWSRAPSKRLAHVRRLDHLGAEARPRLHVDGRRVGERESRAGVESGSSRERRADARRRAFGVAFTCRFQLILQRALGASCADSVRRRCVRPPASRRYSSPRRTPCPARAPWIHWHDFSPPRSRVIATTVPAEFCVRRSAATPTLCASRWLAARRGGACRGPRGGLGDARRGALAARDDVGRGARRAGSCRASSPGADDAIGAPTGWRRRSGLGRRELGHRRLHRVSSSARSSFADRSSKRWSSAPRSRRRRRSTRCTSAPSSVSCGRSRSTRLASGFGVPKNSASPARHVALRQGTLAGAVEADEPNRVRPGRSRASMCEG